MSAAAASRKCPATFWNAGPFHPFSGTEPNRAPTADEIRNCQVYLTKVIEILAPHTLVAVGRKGEAALKLLGAKRFQSVRHPSRGGKADFIAGLATIGISG
jgi:uracil-DNA glycosylase